MVKKYQCYGEKTRFKQVLDIMLFNFRKEMCIYYNQYGFDKPRCDNREILNPNDVPKIKCEHYLNDFRNGCFIATVVYGANAKETNILKQWRDNSLNKTLTGKLVVQAYYRISLPVAKFLIYHPLLREHVKQRLDHLVEFLQIR